MFKVGEKVVNSRGVKATILEVFGRYALAMCTRPMDDEKLYVVCKQGCKSFQYASVNESHVREWISKRRKR